MERGGQGGKGQGGGHRLQAGMKVGRSGPNRWTEDKLTIQNLLNLLLNSCP
jgi:hypothetical protein